MHIAYKAVVPEIYRLHPLLFSKKVTRKNLIKSGKHFHVNFVNGVLVEGTIRSVGSNTVPSPSLSTHTYGHFPSDALVLV